VIKAHDPPGLGLFTDATDGVLPMDMTNDGEKSREFTKIQGDLAQVTEQLQATNDPNLKRELLRKMRILLQEATESANRL